MKSINFWTFLSLILMVLSVATVAKAERLKYPTDCRSEVMERTARSCNLLIKREPTNRGNMLITIASGPIAHYGSEHDCETALDTIERRCIYSNVNHYSGSCEGQRFSRYISDCGLILSSQDKTIHDPAAAVVPENIATYPEAWNCWKNMDAINFLCREDYTYED